MTQRWREAWERSNTIFGKHTDGINPDVPDVMARLEAEHPGLSPDEIDTEAKAFLDRLGVTQHRIFEAWFSSYSVPEPETPDLNRWPSTIPAPPDEPLDDWERVVPYMDSLDAIEQLASFVYLMMLGAARAVREEHALLERS